MCEESLLKINIVVFEQEGKKDAPDLGISSEQHVAILERWRFNRF